VLDARLFERAGIRNRDITTIFLTTFRAAHRGALAVFDNAKWLIHENEKKYARAHLEELYRHNKELEHEPDHECARCAEDLALIANDLDLLSRCEPAPEKLADQVELFPSPGASAGSSGLLLTPSVGAIVVAGDAVINTEYLEHGRVWEESYDLGLAQQSLQDILEVADMVIPGHDNIIPLLGKIL